MQAAAERANSYSQKRTNCGGRNTNDVTNSASRRKPRRTDHVTTQLTAENNTLRETVASLRGELARRDDVSKRLTDERDSLMRERDALQATVQTLQPQADALARIKSDVQGELNCLVNADEKVLSLHADLESLNKEERTMTVLERMKEILFQLKTLQHAYRVGEGVV